MTSTKRDVVKSLVDSGSVVRLYVDPRPPGVMVPAAIKRHEWVCLDIGLPSALARPIPDLVIGDFGVYGTLSFGGSLFHCEVPYDQIHAARHEASGGVVSWCATATAVLVEEKSVPTERLTPTEKVHAEIGKVIDFASAKARLRRGRRWGMS